MTAAMRASLLCDHPDGCVASFDGVEERIGDARATAAKKGWIHRVVPRSPGRPMHAIDLCPVHAGRTA